MAASSRGNQVLVTGGAGFIGSHLVEELVRQGRCVTVIDNLSTGRRSNLTPIPVDRLTFIEDDLSTAIPSLDPADFDEIYHLAAAVGVRLVVEKPIYTIENNIQESLSILQFAARAAVPTMLASTSEVYGKSGTIPFAESDDLVLGPTTEPRWAYACSKAIDEFLGLAWFRDHGLPVSIVRFFNTVGPRQSGTWGMVLPRFVAAARAGEPLQVYGDGDQCRCFCDVRDVATLLPRLLHDSRAIGSILNVGRDEAITIAGLAERVVRILQSDSPIQFVPYEAAYGRPFEDMMQRQPDISRIRDWFSFEPTIDLDQTIRDLANSMDHDRDPAELDRD